MLKKLHLHRGKYGLYDNNGRLYCKPCGKKMDETREDSLTRHVTAGIHDVACAKLIQFILFVLPLIVLRGNRSAYCWCCAGAWHIPPLQHLMTGHAGCCWWRGEEAGLSCLERAVHRDPVIPLLI